MIEQTAEEKREEVLKHTGKSDAWLELEAEIVEYYGGDKELAYTANPLPHALSKIARLQSELDRLTAENKVIRESFDSMGDCITKQASALMAAEKLALEYDTLTARMKEIGDIAEHWKHEALSGFWREVFAHIHSLATGGER